MGYSTYDPVLLGSEMKDIASTEIYELAETINSAVFDEIPNTKLNSQDAVLALAVACGIAIMKHTACERTELSKSACNLVKTLVMKAGQKVN